MCTHVHTHNQCVLMNQILSIVHVGKRSTFPFLLCSPSQSHGGSTLERMGHCWKEEENSTLIASVISHIQYMFLKVM